ncbi:hypothetical protein MMC21_007185 [Puttea exsequens]|nr:hypothetical protein [Puttea exsequens]
MDKQTFMALENLVDYITEEIWWFILLVLGDARSTSQRFVSFSVICTTLSLLYFPQVSAKNLTRVDTVTKVSHNAQAQTKNIGSLNLFRLISYLPIPLFAETLRVQAALVDSIASSSAITPALTGCVKDFHRLWALSDYDLFGDFGSETHSLVASLRHGNSFPLANRALLAAVHLTGRNRHLSNPTFIPTSATAVRPTVLNVSFVMPKSAYEAKSQPPYFGSLAICRCIVALELLAQVAASAGMAYYGLYTGAMLLSCMSLDLIGLASLRETAQPILAHARSIKRDTQLTAAQGAALDVHVCASHWNSSHLDVVCGYSSQLHALTNIPCRATNISRISWLCRFLATTLLVQAATLTSLIGTNSIEALGGGIWLIMYLLMLIPPWILRRKKPFSLLEEHGFFITGCPPLIFSSRRAALVFLSMLPLTPKAPRWDWLDVFIPANDRRRDWQREIEKSVGAMRGNGQIDWERERGSSIMPSFESQRNICEALSAFRDPGFSHFLTKFKGIVHVE